MARYFTNDVNCACCKKNYSANILTGLYFNNSSGLDTNPHQPEIYDLFVMCPHCGYVTKNLRKHIDVDIEKIVNSREYQELFTDTSIPNTPKKLMLAALLSERQNKLREAGYNNLQLYWYYLDLQDKKISFLDNAIKKFSEYLENFVDIETAMILIDCLRQSERFDEAKETAESLLQYITQDNYSRIVNYELKLILNNDAEPHFQNEVVM